MAAAPTKSTVKAFTLIELLVVIGVIAVLVSMLMVVLASSRAMARATVCASNIRQLDVAFLMYAQANHGTMMVNSQAAAGGGVTWWFGYSTQTSGINRDLDIKQGLISQYLGNNIPASIQCPDFPYGQGWYNPKFAVYAASYGLNKYLSPLQNENRGVRLTKVKNPAHTVVFIDGIQQDFSIVKFNEPFYLGIDNGNPNYGGFVHFRHRGRRANAAFVDGHVESINMTDCQVIHASVGGAPVGNLTTGATDSNTLYGDPRS
jgi:prepilin-type processing-associated H-X9-DG protein/prepilin-type N-terminal cleavage/methylation domain-containing protein